MSERVAIADLGSHAVRLVLARVSAGEGFTILREARVATRLGSRPGRLPSRAVRETVDAVNDFIEGVRDEGAARVLAVGTAALRDARNAGALRAALREAVGVDLVVLTGAEEARLGAIAALSVVPTRDALVFDLGGGSLQLCRVRHGTPEPLASLPLGALRATVTYLRHDPPRTSELTALRDAVRHRLRAVLPAAAGGKYQRAEPPADALELARRAAAAFGLFFTGVDLVERPDGGFAIFEVSAFGGYRGLLEACGVDAAPLVARAALERFGAVPA